ncbi:hypothetical protein ES703_125503 [subsurface metagenome]
MTHQIIQILWFIVLGFAGGFVYVLMHANDWEGLTKFGAFKRFILGGIIGGLYYILYSEQDFPNMIMTFVSGYMGTDFIEKLVERFKP